VLSEGTIRPLPGPLRPSLSRPGRGAGWLAPAGQGTNRSESGLPRHPTGPRPRQLSGVSAFGPCVAARFVPFRSTSCLPATENSTGCAGLRKGSLAARKSLDRPACVLKGDELRQEQILVALLVALPEAARPPVDWVRTPGHRHGPSNTQAGSGGAMSVRAVRVTLPTRRRKVSAVFSCAFFLFS
jgi:hypothetical protein